MNKSLDAKSPLISVVIPVFNAQNSIGSLIQALLSNPYDNMEILVGDDASEDLTLLRIEPFIDSRLRIFKFPENRGAGYIRNMLLGEARGEYIAMQDADDLFFPERFLKQANFLNAHPEIDVIGCSAVCRGPSGPWGQINPPKKPVFLDWFLQRAVVHASIMFRRAILEKGIRYHETLKWGEDYYFLTGLYVSGARFRNLHECLYIYRIEKGELRSRIKKHSAALMRAYLEISELYPFFIRPFYLGANLLKIAIGKLRSMPQ